MPFHVTITDLPRESAVQYQLGLGMTSEIESQLSRNRSNVVGLLMDDLVSTSIAPQTFAAAVSVEVIEHVDDDHMFVKNLHEILEPGGVAILTTPNGDRQPVPLGDHKRHYRREQLLELLEHHFPKVQVDYAVAATPNHLAGLVALDPRHPRLTLRSIVGNVRNRRESAGLNAQSASLETAHLIAVATKAK